VNTALRPRQISLSGVLLVSAFVIFAVGVMIGFVAPSLREAPWEGDLTAIAGNPVAHAWANRLILLAGLLTTLGLAALSSRFEGPGRTWAWMGMVAFAFAAMFLAIDRIIASELETWAATQDLNGARREVYEAFELLNVSDWFYVMGFSALILYGVALTHTVATRVAGFGFIAAGGFGIAVHLIGGAIPGLVFLGTVALGVSTWRLNPKTAPDV